MNAVPAPLLAARDLSYAYGERPVLHRASAELRPGELLAILGPNGAGKSTLLKLLAGLLEPRSGEVLLEGVPIARTPRKRVAQALALVPQDLPTELGFTALELVLMGRAPHQGPLAFDSAQDRAVALESLRRVGAEPFAARPLAQLSGGERRRVLVARALAQAPRVLLLDEPTAFLDLAHQAHVLELCRDLARSGLAVAAVLHDPNLAAGWSDRALLLGPGQPPVEGPSAEVLTRERLSRLYGLALAEARHPDLAGPIFAPARGG